MHRQRDMIVRRRFRFLPPVVGSYRFCPTPLSCSEGVLRLGPVRAVLVEGRARMCDKRVERSVCLSMTAGTSQPIIPQNFSKLARGFLCATHGEDKEWIAY